MHTFSVLKLLCMSVTQMFASTPSAFLSLGNMVEWGNGGRLVIFFFSPFGKILHVLLVY